MEHIFPAALVGCIRDGREPTADEMTVLTDKVWAESVRYWARADMDLAKVLAYAAACSPYGAGARPLQ